MNRYLDIKTITPYTSGRAHLILSETARRIALSSGDEQIGEYGEPDHNGNYKYVIYEGGSRIILADGMSPQAVNDWFEAYAQEEDDEE